MDRPRIKMSFAEFETIERLLGWKTEYWDGYARLTPRGMGVPTRLDLTTISSSHNQNPPALILVTPTPDYTQQMLDGYIAAFINSVEFCGWPIDRIFEEAQNDISLYFEGKRGKPLSASTIVLASETQEVIGTALVTDKKEQGARLELLYVRPAYQRTGIGTHMIFHIARQLMQQGYSHLTSRYHICNHHSRQFYHKLGFQDIHDRYYLQMYVAWLGNEIWRREKLRMLDEIEEMKQEQKELQTKLDTLEDEFSQEIANILKQETTQDNES